MIRSLFSAAAVLALLVVGLPSRAPAQSEDELIQTYQTAIAALDAHDLDQWSGLLFAEDAVFDAVPSPPPMHGRDAIKAYVGGVIEGFPDFQDTPQMVLASGNTLAVQELYTGTHQAEWFGIPPTGKVNHSLALIILEFENGKVVRETQYWDPFGMLVNLGVMPPPELPPLQPSFELPAPEPTGLDALSADAEINRRWNAHDLAAAAKIIREDAQFFINGMELDRTGYIAMQDLYQTAFPDISMDVTRSMDMGDNWVLDEAVFTGTQQEPYFGVPPSGAQMVNRVGWIAHYDDQGLMTYGSYHWDNLGVLAQLGALPGTGASAVSSTSWGRVKSENR